MKKPFDLSLYLVTDRSLMHDRPIEWIVEEAVKGGATMVQLREKECSTSDFIALGRRLMALLEPFQVPLIINDRVDVALAIDAPGVHIGQSDMSYADARRLLGADKIIGLSVGKQKQVLEAHLLDVDYIGISPVFATPTKTDTARPFGLDGLTTAIQRTIHPSVAIGGMNDETIAEVMQTGVNGVAVVSAIVSAPSPSEAAAHLAQLVKQK